MPCNAMARGASSRCTGAARPRLRRGRRSCSQTRRVVWWQPRYGSACVAVCGFSLGRRSRDDVCVCVCVCYGVQSISRAAVYLMMACVTVVRMTSRFLNHHHSHEQRSRPGPMTTSSRAVLRDGVSSHTGLGCLFTTNESPSCDRTSRPTWPRARRTSRGSRCVTLQYSTVQ